MENNRTSPINTALSLLENHRQDKGGMNLVDGWSPEDWSSLGEYIREGFDQDTLIHCSFRSTQEAVEFINGSGQYSDRNSFFYNTQDQQAFEKEGYFQEMQCSKCLEDLQSQLEEDCIPEEDIINPKMLSGRTEHQETSFKPDEDKYAEKVWYRCKDHPEVYLLKKESWYE